MKVGLYDESDIILLQTITSLHVGVGRTIGVVDMPVYRDGLGFPSIPSSSLKGSLRGFFEREGNADILFGPSVEMIDLEAYAGALAVNEAYLLAMPVRSLRGIWALVTSPFLLKRFREILEFLNNINLLKIIDKLMEVVKKQTIDAAYVGNMDKFSLKMNENNIIILNEEFKLNSIESKELLELGRIIYPDEPDRIIIVHDDLIKEIVERSILRRARIKLVKESKKVEKGGLWTEEDVPANTIFFTWFLYSKSRKMVNLEPWKSYINEEIGKEQNYVPSKAIRNFVKSKLLKEDRGMLIFGGHETIGRGIVKLRCITGETYAIK